MLIELVYYSMINKYKKKQKLVIRKSYKKYKKFKFTKIKNKKKKNSLINRYLKICYTGYGLAYKGYISKTQFMLGSTISYKYQIKI